VLHIFKNIVLLVTSTTTLSDKEKVINKEDSINVIDFSNLYNMILF